MQSVPALRCCFHRQLPIVFLYSIFFFLRKIKKELSGRKKERERTTAKLLVYIITCSFIARNLKH
nr:MAG TPA: hypothetical protein [Caudoviricetes sp.]